MACGFLNHKDYEECLANGFLNSSYNFQTDSSEPNLKFRSGTLNIKYFQCVSNLSWFNW